MEWIRRVVQEVFGLFVDDGPFALSILGWIAVVWLVLPWLALPPTWNAALLFLGLAGILLESALRRARTLRRSRADGR